MLIKTYIYYLVWNAILQCCVNATNIIGACEETLLREFCSSHWLYSVQEMEEKRHSEHIRYSIHMHFELLKEAHYVAVKH